ncbi:transposase [Elizabethkingia anophelis]|uniref:hypothetical protein n=1 Tax=Elizabethkingia anophelis TaxID=1117645 RepID=UPI000995DB55|nr:hypothetical protein [Elizabethkingia anophelis]AQW97698.1 hypothetical protein BBD31_07265 [Elizabethkingia anophelis]ASV77476.1 hypothetical protein A6J37_02025 [Elizabethkingia anophelis]MCL1650203.1 transposase [Elizabethkingia anophelis]MCT4204967.1 transposase [Elizabethkingia anophelis]MDV3552982.1 hypothetical protein [Elizabethkingia anophelis]
MIIPYPELNGIPSEDECISILKEIRQRDFICKKCGCKESYWKNDKKEFECKNRSCKTRISLTANTIMHRTKQPLFVWVVILDFIVMDHKTVKEIQAYLNLPRYETTLDIYNKIKTQLKRLETHAESGSTEADKIILRFLNIVGLNFLKKYRFNSTLLNTYFEWLASEPKCY